MTGILALIPNCMYEHVLCAQVSTLLTNHLSRAMDYLVVSEGTASEALQDALTLLLGLAKSQLGRTILSQPACISKLLLLLTDQRLVQQYHYSPTTFIHNPSSS